MLLDYVEAVLPVGTKDKSHHGRWLSAPCSGLTGGLGRASSAASLGAALRASVTNSHGKCSGHSGRISVFRRYVYQIKQFEFIIECAFVVSVSPFQALSATDDHRPTNPGGTGAEALLDNRCNNTCQRRHSHG